MKLDINDLSLYEDKETSFQSIKKATKKVSSKDTQKYKTKELKIKRKNKYNFFP